jgi:hypothetical protein
MGREGIFNHFPAAERVRALILADSRIGALERSGSNQYADGGGI